MQSKWYKKYLDGKDPREYKGDRVARYDVFRSLINGDSKDMKILDIGSGVGDFLWDLKQSGWTNAAGYDVSEVASDFARRRGLQIYTGDLNHEDELMSLGNDYDLIVMGDVIEHIFAPKRALLTVRKLLKNHGRLLVSVPNAGWFMNGILLSFLPKYYRLSNAFGSWTHVNQYTFWLMLRQLKSCGFQIEKSLGVTDLCFPHRSRGLRNIPYIFLDIVFRISGLLARINPDLFSQEIIILARNDDTLHIDDDYFRED